MVSDTVVTTTLHDDIGHLLGLHELDEDERNIFLQNVGELIIESATLRYMTGLSPEQREVFESWLELHENDENLIEQSLETYPEFAQIVSEEIQAFQSESRTLLNAQS
jgi:hypothetical protein